MGAPPIERTWFIIVLSRVRTPRNAKRWGLGPPPSTCAHDGALAFLASAPPNPQNEKRAILCEKGAYCELASSLSSLDTASEREPAPFGAFWVRQAMRPTPGGGLRAHRRGLERPQLARHGLLSPVPTASRRRRRSLPLPRRRRPQGQHRCHHRRPCRPCACVSCRGPPWPTAAGGSRDQRGPRPTAADG